MRRKFFYLVLSFFILGLILIMAIIVSSNNFINNKLLEDDDKYMASYIDGEYQNEIPCKDDGYIVDKIVCDNGAVATWDTEEWGINIRNATQKIKCSLYFRLKNDVTVTYDNYSTISLKAADKLNDTLPTPTRENYTFLGWYTDPIEGNKISGDTVVTKNTTYYAHWQYNEN